MLRKVLLRCFLAGGICCSPTAEASVFLSEILADPPAGLFGDVNQDGVISASQDEFIEIFNQGSGPMNLSSWMIKDSLKTRHLFPADTILFPYSFIVIFGGGNPQLAGIYWQKASTGTLALNNEGDTVSLLNGEELVIDQLHYGRAGNQDQSLVRYPLSPTGNFVLHSSIPKAEGRLYSPGTDINGQAPSQTSVPEWPVVYYFGIGLFLLKQSDAFYKEFYHVKS